MCYGLTMENIAAINKVFAGIPQITKVILYGSRAKGTFKPGSDIDLTLEGQDIDLPLLNHIALLLDDLLLPYTFDLSVYQHLNNKKELEHIDRAGKIFYEKD